MLVSLPLQKAHYSVERVDHHGNCLSQVNQAVFYASSFLFLDQGLSSNSGLSHELGEEKKCRPIALVIMNFIKLVYFSRFKLYSANYGFSFGAKRDFFTIE